MKRSFAVIVRGLIGDVCPSSGVSLDIGCGEWSYHDAYPNRVVGIDLAPLTGKPSAKATLECLPLKKDSVDFVTCFQTIYYTDDIRAALREMRRVSKERAVLLISVSKPRAIAAVEDPSSTYEKHGPKTWLRIFREGGFSVERLFPTSERRPLLKYLQMPRIYSLFSPYLWFRLSKTQQALR